MQGMIKPNDMERIARTIHVGGVMGLGEEIKERWGGGATSLTLAS